MSSVPRRLLLSGLLVLATVNGGATPASAAGIGQASPSAGRLDVVIRHDGDGSGADASADSLVHLTRTNGTWTVGGNLGGTIHPDSEIGIASPSAGVLDLVARWSDDTLRWRQWTAAGGWAPWAQLATGLTGGPSIATYGAGNMITSWRDASGRLVVRTWGPTFAPTLLTLPSTIRQGTGPALSGTASGSVTAWYLDASTGRPVKVTNTSGRPTASGTWGDQEFLVPGSSSVTTTPAVASEGRLSPAVGGAGGQAFFGSGWGATPRSVTRLAPPYAPTGTPARILTLGGTVAGSTGSSRPGESTLRNTPGASWSNAQASGSPRLDVIWRTDDGCLSTRSTADVTGPDSSSNWSAETRVPTPLQADGRRCAWPGRAGTATPVPPTPTPTPTPSPAAPATSTTTIPVMKRLDGSEWASLAAAHDQLWAGVADAGQTAFFRNRIQALVLHDTGDWRSSWSPRNWHGNTWVYRKGTAFQAEVGAHTNPATAGFFVKVRGTNQLAAVNYECYTAPAPAGHTVGCPQPLLDVTNLAAQNFWLYGATTNPDGSFGQLRTRPPSSLGTGCADAWSHRFDGVLYKLACGYEGVWIDDVFTDLASSRGSLPASRVANFVTGAPLSNADVRSGARLPFTADAWANGMATMLLRLRAGITAMRTSGVIPRSAGTVALNYKWTQHGYGEVGDANGPGTGPDPQLSALPAAATRAIGAGDLIEMEGGAISDGLTPGPVSTDYSFARHRQFVQQVHALGRGVIQEMTDSADLAEFQTPLAPGQRWDPPQADPNSCRHNVHGISTTGLANKHTASQYNFATMLLDYRPGDWIGDMCQYFGETWDGYTTNLGAAVDATATIAGGVLRRRFERGIVLVAPPGVATSTIQLGQPMTWRPNAATQATQRVTQVTLGARRGAVLTY